MDHEFDMDFDFESAVEEETAEITEDSAPVAKPDTALTFMFDGESHTVTPDKVAYPTAKDYLSKIESLSEIELKLQQLNEKKRAAEFKIEELRREFGARLAELQADAEEANRELFDIRRAKRQAEYDVQSAEQNLRDALLAEEVQKEFKKNSVKFDEITAGLAWREWAFDHQIIGGKLIASADGRAILGDEMGLGKTLTSQIACDMLQAQKILVIVPDDVVSNFVREINKWAPHRPLMMIGKMTKMQRDMMITVLKKMESFVAVVNYSAWRKDKSLLKKLVSLRFDTVIMDEAHSIKNVRTAAFKGCAEIVLAENSCPNCRGAIQHVHNSDISKFGKYDNGRYIPQDYFVCVGNNEATVATMAADKVKAIGCGWNDIVDIYAGTKRKHGAKRSVKNVIPMTGTVILNRPQDIFPLLHLMDDVAYDSEAAFLRTYCEPDPFKANAFRFRSGGLESLTKKLAGRYIKRTKKSAGVVLPKQEVVIHNIEMDKVLYADQARIIEQLSKHAMLILESGDKLPIFAQIALITRKRQANVWPAGIEIRDPETGMVLFSVGDEVRESIKLDRIIMEPHRTESGEYEGLVPDYTAMGDKINGDRVVVFSQFKGPLAELERRMKTAGISVVRFDGDTPEHIRNQVKVDFDRTYVDSTPGYEYKWQVCLANYKSGGQGLNFNHATHAIILDEEWNAGKRDQAYGRMDRIGQTEENSVDVLRLDKTIDTWLASLIDNKEAMVEGFESNAAMANSMLDAMRNGEMM